MTHADTYNIIYPLQHGSHKSRLCETQLLAFVDNVSKNLEDRKQRDILIKVFSMVFEHVSNLCIN